MTRREEKLNQRILELKMTIREKYPDLSQHVENMAQTIPDQKHPLSTIDKLQVQYEWLNELLKKCELEHPDRSKQTYRKK